MPRAKGRRARAPRRGELGGLLVEELRRGGGKEVPLRELGGVDIRGDDVGAFAGLYAMMVPWEGLLQVSGWARGHSWCSLVFVGDAASPSSS